MSLREVGAVSFDDASELGVPQLSLFDDQVVLGGGEFNAEGELLWVVRSFDLTKPSASVLMRIPTGRLHPAQDGYAAAIAITGESLAVLLGETSAYAPERTVLCVHHRLEN